jgi:hypothetical protein
MENHPGRNRKRNSKAYLFSKIPLQQQQVLVAGILTTQGRQDWPMRQMGRVSVPALIANIFAVATSRTNIHNKTGSTGH